MHFTRDRSLLRRRAALAYRYLKYAVAAPCVTWVMQHTSVLNGKESPPRVLNFAADGDFVAQGDELVAALQRDFELKDGLRILDIGSGIGRIATALWRAGLDISYDGFDIVPYGVVWCRKKIPKAEGYRFQHADVFNRFYNPRGKIAPTD